MRLLPMLIPQKAIWRNKENPDWGLAGNKETY